MGCRGKIFSKFKKYPEYRDKVRYLKWFFKFKIYPRYAKINKYLKKDFEQISLFRPDCTFTEFDLGIKAVNRLTQETVFIQIVTKGHFDKQGEGVYEGRVKSFYLKKKIYGIIRDDIAKVDSSKLDHLVEFISLDDSDSQFTLVISKFMNCIGLFKLVESVDLSEKQKKELISQIEFYKESFNRCKIFWLDATPHNIIVMKDSFNLAPIDFANGEVGSDEEILKSNEESAEKIIEYINSGFYRY